MLGILLASSSAAMAQFNITLRNATPKTARALFSPAIENIAKAAQSDAQLVALAAGNLSPSGQSTFWNFLFYSPTVKRNFGFAGSDAICFPFFDLLDESDTLEVPLPPNWIDSKVALDSAQARLGREFLQKYPNAEINGFAGLVDFGSGENITAPAKFHFGLRPSAALAAKSWLSTLAKARTQEETAWVISYNDNASNRTAFIALDVQTGKTFNKDSTRQFLILFGSLAEQQNLPNTLRRPIPPGWLDSDKIAPVAESIGGANFRRMNANALIEAFLGYVNPAAPNRLVWSFRYTAAGIPPASLTIYVDALTGVRVSEKSGAPQNFVLRHAYPNPITAGQLAQWSLHAPVAVEARAGIYNALGQRVASILRQNVQAGEAIFAWDGRLANGLPAASGVYFLRFEYRVGKGEWQALMRSLLLQK